MNDEDVKKITKALDERLKPLIGDIAKVKTKLLDINTSQFRNYTELSNIGKDVARIDSTLETINEELGTTGRKLDILWEQVEKVTIGLEEVKEKLDYNKTYFKTGFENTNGNVNKLNKRTSTIEDQLGIAPPPELNIIP